jgi:hypothetical protein
MLSFIYDQNKEGRPYPNLAPLIDSDNDYHGLGDDYPYIGRIRLYYYAQDHNMPINVSYIDQPLPDHAFYPVGIAWFDFSVDYFALMSEQVKCYLREGKLRVLFYYHEGDNPFHQKSRLEQLCRDNNLPSSCYVFVSGNTQADGIENFVYFPDHELFYWRSGVVWNDTPQIGCEPHTFNRSKDFTFLSRVHKWSRLTIAAQLHRQGLLCNSYWSYGNVDIGDRYEDNPIPLESFPGLEVYMKNFLSKGPYRCDEQTTAEHNCHWMFVPEHFNNSYCHLVLETFFDADGSNGCFISEKVFKPMRHGQPFIVFGTPYTLDTLRQLGYKTFDEHIDNSYDAVENNEQRFKLCVDAVAKVKNQDMQSWYNRCLPDIIHNRNRYISSAIKLQRLQSLVKSIL